MDNAEQLLQAASPVRQRWLSQDLAIQHYLDFESLFGPEAGLLACHLAFPLIVTPELINLIRINFLDGLGIPWVHEPDFLLAPFCQPIHAGLALYQIDPAVREVMLVDLPDRVADGNQRLYDLADFLLAYLGQQSQLNQRTKVARVHQWVAWSLLDPQRVVEDMSALLAETVREAQHQQASERILSHQIQVATMMEIVREPIERHLVPSEYEDLLQTSQVLAHYWYGGMDITNAELEENTNPILAKILRTLRQVAWSPNDAVTSTSSEKQAKGSLTKKQKQQLHTVLLEVYQRRIDLEKLLLFNMGESLNTLVVESGLIDTIYDLIEWAEQHDRLQELMNAVIVDHPTDESLQNKVNEIRSTLTPKQQEQVVQSTKMQFATNVTPRMAQQLYNALLDVYETQKGLERMLFFNLDLRLHEIQIHPSLADTMFELIKWVTSKGSLQALLDAAINDNPNNTELKSIINLSDELTGRKAQLLHNALTRVYKTRITLETMVRLYMNVNLNIITSNYNLEDNIFELILWANMNGRLQELMDATVDDNRNDMELRATVDSVRSNESQEQPVHTSQSKHEQLAYKLRGRQAQQLYRALLNIYETRSDLETMVTPKMSIELDSVVAGSNLEDNIFELIKWADRNGRLQQLISVVVDDMPNNEELRVIVDDIRSNVLQGQKEQVPQFTIPRFVDRLLGEQAEQIYNVLLAIYPNYIALDRMVFFHLDVYLDEIGYGHVLPDLVFELIKWADSNNRIHDLVNGTISENPKNIELKSIVDRLHIMSPEEERKQEEQLIEVPLTIKTTEQQFLWLRDALLDAYPSHFALEQVLTSYMNISLDHITPRNSPINEVSALIKWSEDNNKLSTLMKAVMIGNPRNLVLRSVIYEICYPSSELRSEDVLGSRREISGGELWQLRKSLLDVYNSHIDLERMSYFKMNVLMSEVTEYPDSTNLEDILFKLIQWAEANYMLQELMDAVLSDRPNHSLLRSTIDDIRPLLMQ
ncbi:MAG: effector-associated domain EAD1-containing protein [Chloroflexota bacterium]